MFKTFGSEVLLAEDLNGIMRQTIIRVADTNELDLLVGLDIGTVAYVEANDTYYRRSATQWVSWLGDTGWESFSFAAGFKSYPSVYDVKFRVLNGVVYFAGLLTNTAEALPPSSTLTVGTLPTYARPGFSGARFAVGTTANQHTHTVDITPGGVVSVRTSPQSSAYVGMSSIVFPLG